MCVICASAGPDAALSRNVERSVVGKWYKYRITRRCFVVIPAGSSGHCFSLRVALSVHRMMYSFLLRLFVSTGKTAELCIITTFVTYAGCQINLL